MQKHTNICKDRYESTFFGINLIVYCIIRVLMSASYFYINTVLYSVTIFLFFFLNYLQNNFSKYKSKSRFSH